MDGLTGRLTMQAGQLVAADLAQPGEESRFPSKALEVAYRFDQAVLHHILDASGVQMRPPCHECGKPLGVCREKSIECRLFAGSHARDQPSVVFVHVASQAALTGRLSALDVIG
jgi:hypothetical protein